MAHTLADKTCVFAVIKKHSDVQMEGVTALTKLSRRSSGFRANTSNIGQITSGSGVMEVA